MGSTLRSTMLEIQLRLVTYMLLYSLCIIFVPMQCYQFVGMLPILCKMLTKSSIYLGFAHSASHHSQNLVSFAWVIYTPQGQLVSLVCVYLQPSSNNVVEYSILIEILCNIILNVIQYLEVLLDSLLVVSQLNCMYRIRYPMLLTRFLRVRL